ncbi:putative glycoside hydrolase [Fusobacterium sp.]|uniref:putative glycoside hydrolase n=1 Tax=Fusobacterium sp. TaxID=68766 RepID=UPI0025C058C3|nr:putative glycoside hydrolase [Fusobacterium sp.]MCI5725233.1 putative glycoside hydrolase [Fusobacterium sp.]
MKIKKIIISMFFIIINNLSYSNLNIENLLQNTKIYSALVADSYQILYPKEIFESKETISNTEEKAIKKENNFSDEIKSFKIEDNKSQSYQKNPRVKVKGIYVTAKTLALEKRLDELLKLSKENGINAFVIDVKGDFGEITFPVSKEVEKYSKYANKKVDIKNIKAIMKKLKDNNIYTIARIVSFKDPTYAKENPDKIITYKSNGKPFLNKDGLTWVSPYDENLWEYNVFIAKEAAKVGFNEIQFDYVRFPASNGGKLDAILDYKNPNKKTKVETIQAYLAYAKKELEGYDVYLGADVYGQIAAVEDDMGLGQNWEAISAEVDYISPMIYPSHYSKGVYGLSIPDAKPYETVYYATKDSIDRNSNMKKHAIIRPWIQAFTAKWIKGHIKYGPKEVKEQIKAMNDLGIDEYILWNPANRYEKYF